MHYNTLNPTGEAINFVAIHTDSAKIKAEMKSTVMLDYSSAKYPFYKFPEKIIVTVFGQKKQKTIVEASSAQMNNTSKVIELFGKVKITFPDGKVMNTNLLYFDQKNNWFYTENYFKIKDKDSYFEGIGIDFDSEFKIIDSQQNRGEIKNLKDENL